MKLLYAVVAVAFLLAQSAGAEGWHKVGSAQAGGAPKEMGVQRACSQALIKATEGSVVIDKLELRAGGGKSTVKGGGRLNAGQSHEISLGDHGKIEKLLIYDSGQGRYDVYVK